MRPVSVILIGIEPSAIDFGDPAYAAYPGITAAKIQAGVEADAARLTALGYEADICFVGMDGTAAATVREALERRSYDCAMMGAGLRVILPNTALFEQVINVVHAQAPQVKLCFNTGPTDSAAAVQRWFPEARRPG